MLILRKEKSLTFTFCLAYFDRSRKSDLEFYQTLSLFYILFLIIYFLDEKILFIIFIPPHKRKYRISIIDTRHS
jgi:hypothetical protein